MEFKLRIYQTNEDRLAESAFHRTCSLVVKKSFPTIKLQLPVEYNGLSDKNNEEINYTPEDLYLGAISGCFFTTFSVVSKNSNLRYENMEIEVIGIMEVIGDVKMMSEISQKIILTLPKGMEQTEKKAKKVLEIVEKRCPLANSIKTIIKNEFIINFAKS